MRSSKYFLILSAVSEMFIRYPAPSNLGYFWNFGVYSIVCLVIQVISGILLAMHYVSDAQLAFISVEHIMRNVNLGWLIRYIHANGASMFFIVVYIHLLRGLYFTSYIYPRELLWVVGVIILLLMIVTAFMGYVLPWGQMSFWGATVITNLFSAIPSIGNDIVIWLWGGYSVGKATLSRFFSFHFFFPFIIFGLVIIHLLILHEVGSNNPLGVKFKNDNIVFYPYYIIKDLYGLILFLIFFSVFLFFMPNMLGHPDNYIEANSMLTPVHIVPEWYFLPFYAILRSIPDKLGGVLALVLAICTLFLLPFIDSNRIRSMNFRPFSRAIFWFFVIDCVFLGIIGSKAVKFPFMEIGQYLTIFYFLYFIIFLPVISCIEDLLWKDLADVAHIEPYIFLKPVKPYNFDDHFADH